MNLNLRESMVKAVVDGLRKAVVYLPIDVKNALKKAYEEESSLAAKAHLEAILKNVELAERLGAPLCQDTGIITFYVRLGARFPGIQYIESVLVEATRKATVEIPLRPNSVDPFTGLNSGDNTGRFAPVIIWDGVNLESDSLEIVVVPKGGGSEYVSTLYMAVPSKGIESIEEAVLDAVIKAGAMPCPPTIIGVGIGGTVDLAMHLAKKAATIRKIGSRHPNPFVAELEEKLLRMVNDLGIGAMGMGGKASTALAVHVEYAYRHPATYPIAIAFQCWAARRAFITIKPDGSYTIEQ
ncbi:fumarate hydratase [Ignisphaera sp. 4213-co]|uniref:Fumarate hydratase n=1 Tax=Ignisphaera cupida TaxID=3050454 RepID=A0ABD4Z4V0_9CREN|nr:fumarate hydratase [Ignisphaera sp. 4213-co]MDK6028175.1 fumarate hydratase [Ignisphaera sp. 4213-co]